MSRHEGHPKDTQKINTDLSFFTGDPKLGNEVEEMCNYKTGYATPSHLEKISSAPLYLRKTLIEHIEKEMEHAAEGRPGHIWAKLNSLVDDEIIDWLYRASQAGVQIDLVIRAICCLRPGIRGLSVHNRVKSIVGRKQEGIRIGKEWLRAWTYR